MPAPPSHRRSETPPGLFDTLVGIAPLLPRGWWLGAVLLATVYAMIQGEVVRAFGTAGGGAAGEVLKISGGEAAGALAFPTMAAYVLGFLSLMDPASARARGFLAGAALVLTLLCVLRGWLFGPLAQIRAQNAEALAAGSPPLWEIALQTPYGLFGLLVPPLGLACAMLLTRIQEAAAERGA